ncbi:hypothetical protein [Parageobacillus thermoglucosidasius]|uniref:Uncharacterized protein n=1 Tax=Geobacillus sp. (strain Y4.1MC1) TaxID=581103 RepID=A0A7U4DLH1_GEOS0|nr:hypothetical protein [Parageobacillus thermoglucosidasius]MED4904171.1 hypothetical protein [Parageobacillus thermoglucosidasius]MED4914738.1 hypothetical protein [Parageobacillus thermoglucosidasius]MED4943562.1 hypothetical protein [Parageobacillus thermoglucosidasius]MED4982707.1 hypothetical protein [Parageobacillus thermoglucosidasius]RDE27691.1 hypothetical protein DV714_09855 [Parageobacillus thermoglucosidasius]
MKLIEALEKLNSLNCSDVPFSKLFEKQHIDIINKGRVGQLLELLFKKEFMIHLLRSSRDYPDIV